MTWARGFFRLWIVVTLLWCGAVAALGKDEFKGLWQPNVKLEVSFKGEIVDVLDGSRPEDELRRQITEGVRKGAEKLVHQGDTAEAKKQMEGTAQTADELLKIIVDEIRKRADRLHTAFIILLVPPIALLVFGVAIAWIAGGFRRAQPDAGSPS